MKQTLGHYEIVAELGRGGMGVVYKGYDAALDRHVALKVLSPALAHEPSVRERFLREARSMAALNDPHIIQVFYIGVDDDQPFFAMEFVEGENLGSALKREGRIDPVRAREILLKVASGLAVAHDKGVIHRDIKPGNIMLTKRGGVKLADFGIALATQQDISKKLTGTGEFVGTPGYLSPEVCLGKVVDQRSDIFSLGIVLFEMLTGSTPFSDESPLGLMLEVVRSEIPDVRQVNQDVDDGTYAVLKKMVAKDPDERYQDCHEIVEDLVALGTSMISTGPHRLTAGGLHAAGAPTPAPGAVSKITTPMPPAGPATRPITQSPAAVTQLRASGPPLPPPVAAAAAAQVAGEATPARRGGAIWPIAAVVALLVSGAAVTAVAFKDRLWPAAAAQASAVPATTLVAGDAASASISNDAASSAPTSTEPSTWGSAAPAAGETAAVTATAAESTGAVTDENATAAADQPSAAELAQIAADLRAASEELRAARAAAQADTGAEHEDGSVDDDAAGPEAETYEAESAVAAVEVAHNAPRPRQGVAETLRERQRQRIENAANRSSAEPPVEPVSSGPPRVFVMSVGDSGPAGVAENVIEGALLDAGISITDESFAPGIGGLLSRSQRDLPALLAGALKARRGDVLVLVRVVPLGQQTITFYGQSDVLTTASLEIMLLSLGERRLLGRPITARIDYTGMSAIDKATEAVEPQLAAVVATVRDALR